MNSFEIVYTQNADKSWNAGVVYTSVKVVKARHLEEARVFARVLLDEEYPVYRINTEVIYYDKNSMP